MSNLNPSAQTIIFQTRKWIQQVVIDCNFCPFAAGEFLRDRIRYEIIDDEKNSNTDWLLAAFKRLDQEEEIETTLLIFPSTEIPFQNFLRQLEQAQLILDNNNYEGIYQLASFHPHYQFAGSTFEEVSNYTNRSPYPMIHILREGSLTKALEKFPDPENIPIRNIQFTQEKGLEYMQQLLASCL